MLVKLPSAASTQSQHHPKMHKKYFHMNHNLCTGIINRHGDNNNVCECVLAKRVRLEGC